MSRPNMALYLKWDDFKRKSYRVGILVQTEDYYYLAMRNKENIKEALKNGYIGLPGFNAGEVYGSPRVFDFIKRRITAEELENPCVALMERNEGRLLTDSYYFEYIPKTSLKTIVQDVKEIYENQQKFAAEDRNN